MKNLFFGVSIGCLFLMVFLGFSVNTYAQDDPCVPAYVISTCNGDAACRAAEDKRRQENIAKCRAEKGNNQNSSNPAPPPQPKPQTSSVTYENSATADQRTRLFNAQKKCVTKVCASSAEAGGGDERTRRFNQQKKKEQAGNLGCAGCENNEKWIVEPNKQKGLLPGVNGEWKEKLYPVSCWGSDKMAQETYLSAFIANKNGEASCQGGSVSITNSSFKYPAYVGVNVINKEILPNKTEYLPSPVYRGKQDTWDSKITLMVKWWVPYEQK